MSGGIIGIQWVPEEFIWTIDLFSSPALLEGSGAQPPPILPPGNGRCLPLITVGTPLPDWKIFPTSFPCLWMWAAAPVSRPPTGRSASILEALTGVVTMAGVIEIGSMGEVEESSIQRVFNINVLGMFRVNKTFLPMLLKGGGRIINISSKNGWESGGPFNGTYAMSKHSVEAHSDSLRREVMLLGIKVIKIQSGPFKTDFVTTSKGLFTEEIEASNWFRLQLRLIAGMMDAIYMKANPPEIVACVTWRAMTARNPRTVYSVWPDARIALLELHPPRRADGLLGMILKKL
jgi:NAD(P)-dependent dehydrogenase (short-subunit alcohol dehydrogenase family)